MISARCPSFLWGGVDGAGPYELIVVRSPADHRAVGKVETPVIRVTLPAGARSWTPPVDQCLAAGGRYGWAIRFASGGGGEWSQVKLFEVASSPSRAKLGEASALVERARGDVAPPVERRSGRSAPALTELRRHPRPATRSVTGVAGRVPRVLRSSKAEAV